MEREVRPARPHCYPVFCRAECQEQVNKFPSASFKKFATEKDAWTFVRAGLPGPQQQQPEPAGSAPRRPGGRRGRRAVRGIHRGLGSGTAAVPALWLLLKRGHQPLFVPHQCRSAEAMASGHGDGCARAVKVFLWVFGERCLFRLRVKV